MTRSALAMLAVAGLFFACLPELSPLKSGVSDAGDETPAVLPINPCGDGFIDDDAGEECDIADASTACIDCKIACPGVTDDASAHCYYVAEGGVTTYQNAITACPGGHVVTVGSDREAMFVDGLDAGSYWIGASDDPVLGGFGATVATEPGFPKDGGCPGCFARTLIATDAGGECVIATDGGWALATCADAGAATICEREPVGVRSFFCQGPYCATVKGTTKRYVIYVTAAANAATAAAECARYEDGRLVVFTSREERERLIREVVALLEPGTTFTAWIGLTNDAGTWRWDDGQPVDDGGRPSPWGDQQPSANSGRAFLRVGPFLDSQLAQANGDDAALRAFICQRAP